MVKRLGKRGVSKAEARKIDAASEAKKKANKVEVKSHAAPKLPLPDRDKVLAAIEEVMNFDAKLETMRSKRRLLFKGFKTQHISADTIKEGIAFKRSDDEEAFRRLLEEKSVMYAAVGATFQLTISDTMYKDAVAQGAAEGKRHGAQGKSMECRFPENSPGFDSYVAAYRKAQAELVPGAEKLTPDEMAEALTGAKVTPIKQRQPEGVH